MKITILLLALIFAIRLPAQTKADIFGNAPITWLGLDLSHLKIIGKTANHDKAGIVTNDELQAKYCGSWNRLFFDEKYKFNIAEAVHRNFVGYAMDITEAENNKPHGAYFTGSAAEYQLLTEDSMGMFINRYDFKKNKGIGLLFFVEGMNKDKMEASMWATFVDMGTKKVLLTRRITGLAGGAGFRNFWARSFFNAICDMKAEFNSWQ